VGVGTGVPYPVFPVHPAITANRATMARSIRREYVLFMNA
jgi:hypothetical protein